MARKQAPSDGNGAQPTFEQAFAELTDIVEQLERGEMPLERSLELHTRGQTLVKHLSALLETAELRIREISETTPT